MQKWDQFTISRSLKDVKNAFYGSNKLTIYITRIKYGKFSNSAPCNLCIQKIKKLGISKIKYTHDEKTKEYDVDHKSKSFRMMSKYMKF
jgi:deoxycytidylate deaminase